MSRVERAICCGAVWRSSSAVIVRKLHAQRLGRDVLEIGAGSGSVAQQLLSKDPELAPTAMDIDPHMTQAAATRLLGFPNPSAKTADAMPFPGNCFDSVVSCLMLHNIVDWERAVCEVARVLRPGGTFLGYNLVRTPVASVFHRLDGSPHRLIVPRDFWAECARNGLTISLQSRLLGHVMRFAACKDTANAGDTSASLREPMVGAERHR
jgi:ubiquinone/menaquinone biosynthesis C-methylase UbiE